MGNLQFVLTPFQFNLICVKELDYLYKWTSTFSKGVCTVTDEQGIVIFKTFDSDNNEPNNLYCIDGRTLVDQGIGRC